MQSKEKPKVEPNIQEVPQKKPMENLEEEITKLKMMEIIGSELEQAVA